MSRKVLAGMFVLILLCLCSTVLRADDDIKPLDIKTGLWETTVIMNMGGLPPIPPDVLDKMTPDQRARLDAAMKAQQGKPQTQKHCVTKEELNRKDLFNENQKNCTRTVVTSSGSKLVMHLECMNENMKTSGTFRVEATSSENVTGTVDMVMSGNGRTMNVNSTFTAKYIAPVCGDIK